MRFEENKSLQEFNTFGIDCRARYFISVTTLQELKEALSSTIHTKHFILGGGSNMLLTKDIDALVIHVNLKGINVISENDHSICLEVMAGENWHELVLYCVTNGYGGIENLSLIPGNVGTAPIQNIGAYGVELKDVFVSCRAIHVQDHDEREFSNEDCNFTYRNSIFKSSVKGQFVITHVRLKLTKSNHKKSVSYGAIQQELVKKNIENPSIGDISDVVIAIRKSKLPDPKELGNSGSFFKNPVVSRNTFIEFQEQWPDAPYYEISPSEVKIPAGWLIEQAGFKGSRFGDAGVHKNQALVLVNYGNATGTQLWELALTIQGKVKEMFDITIEPEVNVV